MKVSVFGIGYVGAVSAACLARDGHFVVAVDIVPEKVNAIQQGISPIVEPELAELIRAGVADNRLHATTDVGEAIAKTDLSFVCVGTPTRGNGSLETDFVARVANEIGRSLATKVGFHSVVIRSTILPGTMEELVIPALGRTSKKRVHDEFGVAYYPEFLREGSAIVDYDKPGAIIFGVEDERTLKCLGDLHSRYEIAPRVMSIRAAEAVKYANNAWHALKVSFANELGLICKALDVDSHDVMDAVCADTKLNISRAYLTPGFAFGGSCLPKDLAALRHRAKVADVETPLLNAAVTANQNQLARAYSMIEAVGKRRVGIIGLSFKPQTDDLRHSPFVELAERLIGRGFQVRIYDPILRLSRLTGANSAYVQARLPHIADLLSESIGELVQHSEVIVIGNRDEAAPLMHQIEAAGIDVIDLVRVSRQRRSGGKYQGLCW